MIDDSAVDLNGLTLRLNYKDCIFIYYAVSAENGLLQYTADDLIYASAKSPKRELNATFEKGTPCSSMCFQCGVSRLDGYSGLSYANSELDPVNN